MTHAGDQGQGEFVRFVVGQMGGGRALRTRRMFGGYGLYRDGLMFAIIIGGRLYFKADDVNRRAFEDRGLSPFSYQSRGKTVAIRYYEAPDDVFDESDEMQAWAAEAFEAALRARDRLAPT